MQRRAPGKKQEFWVKAGFLVSSGRVRFAPSSVCRVPNFLFSCRSQRGFLVALFIIKCPVLYGGRFTLLSTRKCSERVDEHRGALGRQFVSLRR